MCVNFIFTRKCEYHYNNFSLSRKNQRNTKHLKNVPFIAGSQTETTRDFCGYGILGEEYIYVAVVFIVRYLFCYKILVGGILCITVVIERCFRKTEVNYIEKENLNILLLAQVFKVKI